jgi:hypothetical protein
MVEEILEALLQIRGNGVRPGLEDWQRITEILVEVERKLIGLADLGGRYGASVLAIQWARKASQKLDREQMLKALAFAIEQLEAKTAGDLHALNISILSSNPISASWPFSVAPEPLVADVRKPAQSESHPRVLMPASGAGSV